jgi:hypothetical protein
MWTHGRKDRQAAGQTKREADNRTDGRDEANSRFSRFRKHTPKNV